MDVIRSFFKFFLSLMGLRQETVTEVLSLTVLCVAVYLCGLGWLATVVRPDWSRKGLYQFAMDTLVVSLTGAVLFRQDRSKPATVGEGVAKGLQYFVYSYLLGVLGGLAVRDQVCGVEVADFPRALIFSAAVVMVLLEHRDETDDMREGRHGSSGEATKEVA